MQPNQIVPKPMWWVLWAAFMAGVPQFYIFLGRGSSTTNAQGVPEFIGVIPFFLSAIIRWAVLPRITKPLLAFQLFIIGIAFAEATCFFGLFLIPQQKQACFVLSLIGILQFMPYFARRFYQK